MVKSGAKWRKERLKMLMGEFQHNLDPTLLSTTKVNIGLSLVGVIIGEFLAARRGLGYLIIYGSQVFQLDMVISSILLLCVIAMLLYLLTQSLEHYSKKHRN